MKYIIIAPHADDEIIGCYELLSLGLVAKVLFPTTIAMEEGNDSSEHFMFGRQILDEFVFSANYTYLFPDPTYELHPEHRKIGALGEQLLRVGQSVIFYSTNMNAPYIHEVRQPALKRKCLEELYPTKCTLWYYEHKYFLFEGYNKWIMKWGV